MTGEMWRAQPTLHADRQGDVTIKSGQGQRNAPRPLAALEPPPQEPVSGGTAIGRAVIPAQAGI
jgi:hypothetical protein